MKIFRITGTLILALALLSACNSGKDKKNETTEASTSLAEVLEAAEAISPEISNVEDAFTTLEMVEAGYYPILCNDPYSATSYLNSKEVAAANLGVYITDIVYHMYGDASSEMFITFSATQELAKYIGLESGFAATLLTELEGGGEISRDSLIYVFNGLMEESEKYSDENEMADVHASFLTGLYIEKIYITSSLLNQAYNKEEKTDADIAKAKKLLAVFQKQLESVDILSASLTGLFSDVEGIISMEDLNAVKENSIILESRIDALLEAEGLESCEQLPLLHDRITAMRNKIVTAS